MKDINEKDAARLVTMIYGPDVNDYMNSIEGNPTVSELVKEIEDELKDIGSNDNVGGEMSKAEYQEVLNQIKSSETRMSMEITNFKNNEDTNF